MKIAIISDIHANFEALKAVLAEIKKKSVDEIWCLGDVVDYGPSPNECCQLIKEKAKYCVAGNHDYGVLEKVDLSWFGSTSLDSMAITRRILSQESRDFLNHLKTKKELSQSFLVHASVKDCLFEYLLEPSQAEENFKNFSQAIGFFGHTHLPYCFEKEGELIKERSPRLEKKIKLKKGNRYLINPGSVGQPRDGDWRPSFGLFDTQNLSFEWERVEYNFQETQKKMRELNLPESLINRLAPKG